MKKIIIILFFSSCSTQRNTKINYFLIENKPVTISKETLKELLVNYYCEVISSKQFIVVERNIFNGRIWTIVASICYQNKVGDYWEVIGDFTIEGGYPKIQKIERVKTDSLVVWLILYKDLVVTRSYVLKGGTWTPL
ncbi:MAG: hypothetical protein KBC11_01785 [Candidatus Pacebacteria bacterium]|nr:hypothetical protein [Candidatus Paceibacterota bacterium]